MENGLQRQHYVSPVDFCKSCWTKEGTTILFEFQLKYSNILFVENAHP